MEKPSFKVETPPLENELKRALSATNLTMLGIGAVIGTGIFVLTGTAAANFAGPALVISFIISGIGCAFAGLCYAEFASMIPTAGSAYAYAYETMGRFIAWIIGWDLILEYLFGASTVAVGWSGYAVSLLRDMGINIPAQLTAAPGTLVTVPGNPEQITALFNLPAFLIILAVTTLLVVGISESARFNNVIVFVKVGVVLAFIAFGAAYVNVDNWEPFIPQNTGTFGEYGWSGIMRASGVIFFAYIGFDAVSTVAQEAKNPQRDMPIGILASLFVCTVLYILVTLVLTGIVPYKDLNVAEPIALGVDRAGSGLLWLRPLIKIGAIAGLSSVMLVMLMGQPRIFYAMAKDNLLPAGFAKVHPRFQTPYVTTILTGVISATVAGFVPINILGELVSIGTLLAFVIVCVGIIILRRKRPDLPRPFRTPLVPLVPILGALICFAQMASLPGDTWLRLIIWMAIGLVIYFTYGRYRTRGKDREAFG
ncbi:MAG: amino acid permease [Ferruginibacter sp.]|nr:amino acid permease [Cytophagales bacterium]